MPEERVETQEPVENLEEALPVGDAPFDTTDKATEEPESESTEVSKEAEEIAEAIKPGEEESAEPEDEVQKILKEVEGEDNVPKGAEKRIRDLVSEVKALRAKLETREPPKQPERRVYTEDELASAMMKAVEDNNSALMRDVISEIRAGVKEELVKMYNDEKHAVEKQREVLNNEWAETVDAYKKYSDTKVPPIWPNSHKDLDLASQTSLLYQVALSLYDSSDPQKRAYYRQPGGQKLAVADAFTQILRTKAGKRSDSKVKTLTKQLTKERMKKSPVSGVPGGEEKPARAQTEQERLDEVIAERRKYQAERGQ
jgi:hypothetical protein